MVDGMHHFSYGTVVVYLGSFSSFVFGNQLRIVRVVNVFNINDISKVFHSSSVVFVFGELVCQNILNNVENVENKMIDKIDRELF